ncbi:hypothetical protein K1T71_003369 [Dendrolimus kikuchii]|uniref:Uncharacterized protein n=1 Tax=Dendrolimus kikuchii TaxID=765133 RepID=A0ACC1DC19_9NEOP|nr:hypothetical protein K1T71_003369 [Dendrolimus kikuchii]
MSSRVLICDLCIFLLFGYNIAMPEDGTKSLSAADDVPKGNCTCAGFSTTAPEADASPLLSQAPGLVVKCDDEGGNTCKTLCNALATATKAKGPEVLCNRLKDANELKLSAFYKVCEKPWIYADITADMPLCCEEGTVKACPSMSKINSTDIIDAKTVM